MTLKNITLSLIAIYMIGALLTGFTHAMRSQLADVGSETLISSTVKYGVYWPFQLLRVASRIN